MNTFRDFFDKWHFSSIKLSAGFAEAELAPNPNDKEAAWEMYVEMITRIVTQPLPREDGDEKTALDSVYSLFPITRQILKEKGYHAQTFSKVAVIILNQVVRPFTARWHRLSVYGAFTDPEKCEAFRTELEELQKKLKNYAAMLASLAEVEDITFLESLQGEEIA